jgi:transposase-like protein
MAKRKGRDQGREVYWAQRLDEQRRSGLSIRAFCREREVSEAAFYFWRRELERRRAERQAQRRPSPRRRAPLFVPVRVAAPSPSVQTPAATPIEIVLAGGRCIRLTPPVHREALADVLAVMEGWPC